MIFGFDGKAYVAVFVLRSNSLASVIALSPQCQSIAQPTWGFPSAMHAAWEPLHGSPCAAPPAATWSARAMLCDAVGACRLAISGCHNMLILIDHAPNLPRPLPSTPLYHPPGSTIPRLLHQTSRPGHVRPICAGDGWPGGLGGRRQSVYLWLSKLSCSQNQVLLALPVSRVPRSSAPKMRTTHTLLVLSALAASAAVRLFVIVALCSPSQPGPVSVFFAMSAIIPRAKKKHWSNLLTPGCPRLALLTSHFFRPPRRNVTLSRPTRR